MVNPDVSRIHPPPKISSASLGWMAVLKCTNPCPWMGVLAWVPETWASGFPHSSEDSGGLGAKEASALLGVPQTPGQ
jgi:hypothetical protein